MTETVSVPWIGIALGGFLVCGLPVALALGWVVFLLRRSRPRPTPLGKSPGFQVPPVIDVDPERESSGRSDAPSGADRERVCAGCGASIPAGSTSCPYCGSDS